MLPRGPCTCPPDHLRPLLPFWVPPQLVQRPQPDSGKTDPLKLLSNAQHSRKACWETHLRRWTKLWPQDFLGPEEPSMTKPDRRQHPGSWASQAKPASIFLFMWKSGNLKGWLLPTGLCPKPRDMKKSHCKQLPDLCFTILRLWAKPLDRSTISSFQSGPENQIYYWLTFSPYSHSRCLNNCSK